MKVKISSMSNVFSHFFDVSRSDQKEAFCILKDRNIAEVVHKVKKILKLF